MSRKYPRRSAPHLISIRVSEETYRTWQAALERARVREPTLTEREFFERLASTQLTRLRDVLSCSQTTG